MTKQEVIASIETAIKDHPTVLVRIFAGTLVNALKLLKDQPDIVRCEDCRFGKRHNVNVIKCMMRHDFCTPEPQYHILSFFCADGELKEGEQDEDD